VRFGKM